MVIVGKVDKPLFLEELKAIAKKHQIENQVYFIDETRDIISYYQAAKIVVAPSFSEGFSLVTAEAMSCENTVIATKNVGVHSELITDGQNGYLFEAGNNDELEEILIKLLKDEIPMTSKAAEKKLLKIGVLKRGRKIIRIIFKN